MIRFLLLLLIPTFCICQQRNDTKIIVVASDTTALFKKVALYMVTNGYSIESKYDDLQTLVTGAHSWPGLTAATYKIIATVKDSSIIFTGQMRFEAAFMGTQPSAYDPIDYRPAKGHMYHKVWDWMEDIARQFGDKITYAKR